MKIFMDRQHLQEELAKQGSYCEGRSPLYAAICRELAADAAQDAPWLESLENAWRMRPFAVGWEAAHLLLACMHFWALKGDAVELALLYPSCGGSGGEPRGAAKGFLRRVGQEFWERLSAALVQTNEVDRSAAWMLAAAAELKDTPFHLIELGTSAGLNLIGDYLPHTCRFVSDAGAPVEPPQGWDSIPHPILSRSGLDLRPRRLEDSLDRLWLKACIWADDLARLERLERAMQIFQRLEKTPFGPRIERCAFLDAPDWLRVNRHPNPGEGLLIFNSIATVYLNHSDYAALKRGIARSIAPWEERAIWVEFERPRHSDGPLELRIHRALKGRLQTKILATGGPRPTQFRLTAPCFANGGNYVD